MERIYSSDDYFQGSGAGIGYEDYEAEAADIRATSRRRLKTLLNLGAQGRLLEIGAGFGYFLDVAADAGFDAIGLDVSSVALNRLRKRHIARKGLLEEQSFQTRFDIVVLFDTLEHIGNLSSFRAALVRTLRPDGLLAITTPDNQSIFARLLGANWWSYKIPEHLVFFNDTAMRHWLKPEFELVYSRPDWQYMKLTRVAKRVSVLNQQLGGFFRRMLSISRLAQLRVLLPNSNRFYVARRKQVERTW